MCVFIGIDCIVANALIELNVKKSVRKISFKTLMKYAEEVVGTYRKITDKKAVLICGREEIDTFFAYNSKYFKRLKRCDGEYFCLQDNIVNLDELKEKFRYPVSYDFIKALLSQESLSVLRKGENKMEKTLNITNIEEAKKNISDIQVYGDGDTFKLLCKASSKDQKWMKSTKVCNVPGGCIVQVSTQQGDNVAEALTFVPNVNIDTDTIPPRLVNSQVGFSETISRLADVLHTNSKLED